MEKQPRLIFAALFAATLALFVGISVYMEKQLRTWMEERIASELLQDAHTIHNVLLDRKLSFNIETLDPYIDGLAKNNAHRVTIIDQEGIVLADSNLTQAEVVAVENHKNRPELLSASLEAPGLSIRFSNTVKKNMMYLAVPYHIGNGKGFNRISISLAEVDLYIQKLRHIQLTFALIGFTILIGIFITAFRFLQRLSNKNKKKLRKKVKQKTNDLIKIQKFSHILASCQDQNELVDVVASSAPSLFPGTSGALSITHPSMDQNEVITIWGEGWKGEQRYHPTDCWAFRRGVPYISAHGGLDVSCKHLNSEQTAICVQY